MTKMKEFKKFNSASVFQVMSIKNQATTVYQHLNTCGLGIFSYLNMNKQNPKTYNLRVEKFLAWLEKSHLLGFNSKPLNQSNLFSHMWVVFP